MKRLSANFISLFGIVSLTTLTAWGALDKQPVTTQSGEQAQLQQAANGDLQELTASVQELPSFLDNVDPTIKGVYQIAGLDQELLQWIPCYCGCAEEAGHLNNGDCFIKEIKSDGKVVWDDHGTRCGVCLETAFESAKLLKDGKTVTEIRTFIDDKYKSGYAKPTPTPIPSM